MSDPYASQRGISNLAKKYPGLYGFLGGFAGTAPDEFERGSVLDPQAATREAAIRRGAEYGFPVGTATQVAPLLRALGLMTRTGRNLERVVRNTSPLEAARQELARVSSPMERSVAVSKRGVAGPVRVGTAGAVQPGRSSALARAVEDFHTHSTGPGYFTLHPGDVAQSKLGKTSVLHTTPEGRLTDRVESLRDPQSHKTPLGDWSYSDPQTYRDWLKIRGKYESNVPNELYNQEHWGDLLEPEGFNMSPMDATYRAIKKLQPDDLELAMSRAESLPQYVDPSRYTPGALARISAMQPAAQRGFSESLVSTRSPSAAMLMRPSEFLSRADPLQASDRAVIEKLKPSLQKGVKELPVLWMDQLPEELRAAYEGRHRMQALQEMYGDDPVLMSLLKGNRFEPRANPLGGTYNMAVDELKTPTEELLRQRLMFGDSPVNLRTLWSK